MDPTKVDTITEWPTPEKVKHVQEIYKEDTSIDNVTEKEYLFYLGKRAGKSVLRAEGAVQGVVDPSVTRS
ncbi:hypothetical protein GP486_004691 [Trichoglossum hirsutum]|uniref:Uncharacterized protein n=1 Tax=Trichoglossum hirsutum TaxID=265104 RepID=A0A9P8RP86_9PEZI|nr:hypothetical protein GP486_004691 [Trichoglossum hirsutum]